MVLSPLHLKPSSCVSFLVDVSGDKYSASAGDFDGTSCFKDLPHPLPHSSLSLPPLKRPLPHPLTFFSAAFLKPRCLLFQGRPFAPIRILCAFNIVSLPSQRLKPSNASEMGNFFFQISKKKHDDRFSMRESKKLVEEHSSATRDAVESYRAMGQDIWVNMEAPLHMLTLQNIYGFWEMDLDEVFQPLKVEEDKEAFHALHGGNSCEILITHEPSNIRITREVLQCLRPGAWLNDEVINLYLELLKERERREPKKFLKCHFFSTFFFKKLISGGNGCDFRAVKRWTAQKKLGYTLIDCDKVFVPIHKDRHWCLAVVNIKDKTFQYLDSLGGMDAHVLEVLAQYFMEEARDKGNKEVNTRFWKQESVDGLPLQLNDWDCGMFMLKYIDFYSRGLKLCFSQKHIAYFRMRTAKEILKLRAE